MTGTNKPESTETEHLPMERWEDEGGKTFEIEPPIPAGRFVKPMPSTAGMQDMPRQWSRKFVIEPFLADPEVAVTGKVRKAQ